MAIDARISELLTNVRRAHTTQDGPQDKIDAEQSAMSPGITDYGSRRNQIFDQLTKIMDDEDPGHTAAEPWRTAVSSWTDAWNSTVLKAEGGIKDATSAIFIWTQKCGADEQKFWSYLAKADVAAQARDFIAGYRNDVQEKTAALEQKWQKLTEAHESFAVSETAAADEIRSLIDEAAQAYSGANKDIEEKAVDAAKVVVRLVQTAAALADVSLPDALSPVIDVLEKGAEFWEAKRGGAEIRMEHIRNAFRADRETVIVMFKDFRADAEQFVKDRGYSEVTGRMEKARAALADFNSNAGSTNGLKTDADALVSQLLPRLQAQADRARDLWDKFVKEHEHKFFGAMSTDFRDALLNAEGKSWDPIFQQIVSQNLNQLAQNWIDRSPDRIVELDQTDIPDAWREQMRALIRDSVARFVESQKKMAATFQPDALYKAIASEYQVTQAELDRFR
jgi:hypothetical protein